MAETLSVRLVLQSETRSEGNTVRQSRDPRDLLVPLKSSSSRAVHAEKERMQNEQFVFDVNNH